MLRRLLALGLSFLLLPVAAGAQTLGDPGRMSGSAGSTVTVTPSSPDALTLVGFVAAQNWVGASTPTTLFTVPTTTTASNVRISQVIVWGGALPASNTCSIAVYCDKDAGNVVYYMAEPLKSVTHDLDPVLICKAGGKLVAYTYQPNGAPTGCDNGAQRPWLILRGRLYK